MDENNFIIVHTAMDAYTGILVNEAEKVMKAAKDKNRDAFNQSLKVINDTM